MDRTFMLAWVDPRVHELQAERLQEALAQAGILRVVVFPLTTLEADSRGDRVVSGMQMHLIVSESSFGPEFNYRKHVPRSSGSDINYYELAKAIVPLLREVHETIQRS